MPKENVSNDSFFTFEKSSAAAMTQPPPLFSLSNPFLTPSSPSSLHGVDVERRRLHDASCTIKYQQLYNRYTLCLARLRDSIEELDVLRRENDILRLSIANLSHRVAELFARDRLLSEFNRLNITGAHAAAPQPLAEHNRTEPRNRERASLPKSISVRSIGYMKMNRVENETTRQKPANQPGSASASASASQRVCVPGVKKEESAMEFDVYNQGVLKTELCNKWQETGTCPYGENCQFAHGMKELRPVVRHPRYKTEVCRIVLAGDICPYGHRCHFRHALTEEELLMAAPPH